MREYFLFFAIIGVCYCATSASPPPKNQPTSTKKPITGPANVTRNSTSSAKQITVNDVWAQSTKKPENVSLQSGLGSATNSSNYSLQSELRSSSNVQIEITNRLGYVYKSKPSANPNEIITTRLGGDGVPCQCISYHLCDSKDVYLTNPNDPWSTFPCEIPYQTCCNIPKEESLTSSPPIYTGNATVPNPSTGDGNCVCVSGDRCKNERPDFSQLNDFRSGNCISGQICCPSVAAEPPTANDTIPDPPIEYDCVPSYEWCSNKSLTNSTERVSPCPPPQYYCPATDFIMPPILENDANGNTKSVAQDPEDYVRCGYRRLNDEIGRRITPAEDPTTSTSFGEFPWMALILRQLGDRDSIVCGASIASSSLVLTAAHCLKKLDKESIFVRVGEYDRSLNSENEPKPHRDVNISDIIVHPAYDPVLLNNDVAFLVLKDELEFATNFSPICLPLLYSNFEADDIYDANKCVTTGWGRNAYNATAQYQDRLKKADLRLIAHDVCEERLRTSKLGATFRLNSSFICAASDKRKDSCQGDGGGPLFCALKDTPNRYVQVGVTSWGIGCGNEFPGVYASLPSVREWLTSEFNIHNNFRLFTSIKFRST